jgi:glyceraldehyde-3-phosphate dehydrogenase (NAD(P))
MNVQHYNQRLLDLEKTPSARTGRAVAEAREEFIGAQSVDKEEVLDAFRTSSRIALINTGDGLVALNTVKELMADRGRAHDNLSEVALWADMLRVQGDELFYAYMVDNQTIVIPETIDAVRALTGTVRAANESIVRTNTALGIETSWM